MEGSQLPIIAATKDGFIRYADFSGVSTRSQYWYFILTTNIAAIIAQLSFGDLAGNIIAFGTLIPTLAVAVRRVHDVGHWIDWLCSNYGPTLVRKRRED